MDINIKYENLAERRQKMREAEAKGLRMVSDTFDPGWTPKKEPSGTMVFTDVPENKTQPAVSEVETLKQRLDTLENKLAAVESKVSLTEVKDSGDSQRI